MGSKKKLLIVEDEPSLCALLEITLSTDYEVICAGDGQEAMVAIHEHHPECMLLDVMIPIIDAKEICTRVRGTTEYGEPKIIIVTGSADSDTLRTTWEKEFNINGFFTKPYDLMAIKDTLHSLLAE